MGYKDNTEITNYGIPKGKKCAEYNIEKNLATLKRYGNLLIRRDHYQCHRKSFQILASEENKILNKRVLEGTDCYVLSLDKKKVDGE